MIDKDLADFAIKYAQKLGASYAEARVDNKVSNGFMLKNGVPEISGFDAISGIGMRFIVNKGLGFVSTNNLDKEKLKALIQTAINSTNRASSIREETILAPEKAQTKTYEVKQQLKFENVDPSEKLKLLMDADKAMMATKIKLAGRYISLTDTMTEEYLVNTDGTAITGIVPKMSFFYYITVQEKAQLMQRFWQYGGAGGFELAKGWDMSKILVDEAKACQLNLLKGKKLQPKRMDVVTAPEVVGIMVHESGGHPYEADRIFGREGAQAGESFITQDMIGYQIGSPEVNIVDDPTLENSYGFYLYDNEGVKARRKHLVKNGVITELLHNRETAAAMGLPSNGSSRATDYDKESIVRMSNTFLLPGKYSDEELFEGVKEGVYIKNFMEWNIDDKRINQKYVGAEAYMIENGKLTFPVRNPAIEISTFNLWKAVDAVAKKSEFHAGNCGKGEPMQAIPVWFGGPSMRLRGIMLK
jgi:TldD protein